MSVLIDSMQAARNHGAPRRLPSESRVGRTIHAGFHDMKNFEKLGMSRRIVVVPQVAPSLAPRRLLQTLFLIILILSPLLVSATRVRFPGLVHVHAPFQFHSVCSTSVSWVFVQSPSSDDDDDDFPVSANVDDDQSGKASSDAFGKSIRTSCHFNSLVTPSSLHCAVQRLIPAHAGEGAGHVSGVGAAGKSFQWQNYVWELSALALAVVYLINFFTGVSTNTRIAQKWSVMTFIHSTL